MMKTNKNITHNITSKGNMKRRIILTLATIMVVLTAASVAFAGEVSYEGHAEGFVFSPGSSNSKTDLFMNFSNVVPGDSLTDTVDVANNSGKEVKLYMRATGATGEDAAFLSQINLTVDQRDGNNLFNAAADQTGGLADWVLLGNMEPGAKATLDITLNVPITMDNEFQNAVGQIRWQFKAEEEEDPTEPTTKPENITEPSSPTDPSGSTEPSDPSGKDGKNGKDGKKTATGDVSPIRIVIALMIAAAAAAIIIFLRRRDKKQQ